MTYKNLSQDAELMWAEICNANTPQMAFVDYERAKLIFNDGITSDYYSKLVIELDHTGLVNVSHDSNVIPIAHAKTDAFIEYQQSK